MRLVDRFVCRREGHQPSVTVTDMSHVISYVTTCQRCRKKYQVINPALAANPPYGARGQGQKEHT